MVYTIVNKTITPAELIIERGYKIIGFSSNIIAFNPRAKKTKIKNAMKFVNAGLGSIIRQTVALKAG